MKRILEYAPDKYARSPVNGFLCASNGFLCAELHPLRTRHCC